jgi:hypothetical protein
VDRAQQAAKAMQDEEMLVEIEDFVEGFNQPTYRGMRINGHRVAIWSPQHGWSGDNWPMRSGSNKDDRIHPAKLTTSDCLRRRIATFVNLLASTIAAPKPPRI